MNNETNTTPNVNENSDLQTTQEHSERPRLLEGQGFSLLRYFTTDQEPFDEVELFEECIAPLAGVIARKCDELGIPCYMVFTPRRDEGSVEITDMLASAGPERLTHPVLMAAAAVRCDAEEAAFVDEVSDKRTALYRKRLAQEGEGKPD